MSLKSNTAMFGSVLVLLVVLVAQSGCSCQPEPVPEEKAPAASSGKADQKEKSKPSEGDSKPVAQEGQQDTTQGGISNSPKGTPDGSGSGTVHGHTSTGSDSGEAENIFEQGAQPAATPKSSGGAPGGKTSGSGKGPKRRFSVGTVLNEGAANEMSKGATLSPEELKAKAGEALEEARRMVKKKNWSQGYQSASVCYEFLMRLPAGAENADVTALKEECTRLLKNCSTHLDTKLPSGDDKAIVIE